MTATMIETTGTHVQTSQCAKLAAALRAAHRDVSDLAAGLDLNDVLLWAAADSVLAEISAEAYAMTAALTGAPSLAPAAMAPPVVRLRELAAAQRRLEAALDKIAIRPPGPLVIAARHSLERVTTLGRWLGVIAVAHEE